MIRIYFIRVFRFTRWVNPLRGGLDDFQGAGRRYNALEWNDHSASLSLALHPENHALHPVQLRFLG